MRVIETPQVYLIAKTALVLEGLQAYLASIGSPNWAPDAQVSDGENLLEAAGRLCYRSWQPYDSAKPEATNPNVTRVREGNDVFLKNIIESGHGSVLEHVSLTFLFRGVSRVLTHELVRHRAGMAYSQESLRYVRLDDLSFWFPQAIKGSAKALAKFEEVVQFLEGVQKELAEMFSIETMKRFQDKKKLTSIFRRLAPIGLGTTIMVTGNLRAWRHVIAMRTSSAAEEEIRIVGKQVAEICRREYPNAFFDMLQDESTGQWVFKNNKV